MLVRLILLFTLLPALELYLLLQLGAWIGPLPTFLLVLFTGTAGAWLAKREGLTVLLTLREELHRGIPPTVRLAEGLLVFIGGTLLITPGILTDFAGFTLIFPVTRRWLAPRLVAWLLRHVEVQIGTPMPMHRSDPTPSKPKSNPFSSIFDDP